VDFGFWVGTELEHLKSLDMVCECFTLTYIVHTNFPMFITTTYNNYLYKNSPLTTPRGVKLPVCQIVRTSIPDIPKP